MPIVFNANVPLRLRQELARCCLDRRGRHLERLLGRSRRRPLQHGHDGGQRKKLRRSKPACSPIRRVCGNRA